MRYFAGLDLHSNNTYLGILDEKGSKVYKAKVQNHLQMILSVLGPYQKSIVGAVVESTFNWYWLVDGLMEENYKVHLANPAAIKQYEGLKHTNDYYDAFYLADLLRLGLLKEGYIYPKKERAIRDLFRKRMMLVQQRTSHILSFQGLYNREKGSKFSSNEIKRLKEENIETLFSDEYVGLSAQANISLIRFLTEKIKELETAALGCMKVFPEFVKLKTVTGVGNILALTIALETGDIRRFPKVGNYASYCRCVSSQRLSNEKKKGENNRKNGNKYLGWAFVEAANFAKRYCPYAKSFYNRKLAKTNKIVAIKALAHKLARASYFVIRDRVDYNPIKAFG
jgi:transposase